MKSLPSSLLLLAWLTLPAFFLGGCYTQLATRGDYARSQAAPASEEESAPADSLSGDSALAAEPPAPPAGAPTVIVHNHYDPDPYHRGYAYWEWEYPLLSTGYYSSHYVRYYRPYWWDDPWYSGRRIHRGRYDRNRDYPREPARPAAPAGPYRSEKRLFNPDPAYPQVQKGRRSQEPASAPAAPAPAPAPKESSSGSDGTAGSASPASGPEAGGSGSTQPPSQEREDKPAKERRNLQKGRRR